MAALNMAQESVTDLKLRVEKFLQLLPAEIRSSFSIEPVSTTSTLGGGSLPGQSLDSFGLSLTGNGGFSTSKLANRLRQWRTPVISTVHKDRVILDFRAVLAQDEAELLSAINNLSNYSSGYNEQD